MIKGHRRPKGYNRTQRLADLIQTALAEIIRKDERTSSLGMITVTGVEVARDLSFAKVFISVLQDEKALEVVKKLNEETKYLRYSLANEVELRVTPELKFFYDDSIVRGTRISSLINSALKENKK
jgi:ribosome-binding factor A